MKKTSPTKSDSKLQVDQFIQEQEDLTLLRFITCGSVDDGKSTLIGRILFESKELFDDQLSILKKDSQKYGTQGGQLDYALLVDGLSAEREQGITIDVAYRFFSTKKRKFIVADTPGHEQYTRNMITGASFADIAVILVDARKGILEQTKRHSFIASLVGIKKIILAVNKMDLINFSENDYKAIIENYRNFTKKLDFTNIYDVPISALEGDNVIDSSKNLKWFKGPSMLSLLETISVDDKDENFILPVQSVIRPNLDYRAFSGKVVSGSIHESEKIQILPSGKTSSIKSINIGNKKINHANKNQSISITFNKEIDVSRGDIICKEDSPIDISNIFNINLAWLSEDECFKGRSYIIKHGTQKIRSQIVDLKFKYDINNLSHQTCTSLKLNDICNATISLSKDIPYTNFKDNTSLGKFILIDPLTNQTVGAGMINHSMRRATNIHKHNLAITRDLREKLNGHTSKVLWFTGISGSGKSSIADSLEKKLYSRGIRTFILDGDNVRHGLNNDLGFDDADRVENIRRIGEVSKLMMEAGLFVISSFISPFISDREMVRNLFDKKDFIEIFVDTPIEVAESRDPKGLYRKARAGKIPNFTGISSPYERPLNPEIILNTVDNSIDQNVELILDFLKI